MELTKLKLLIIDDNQDNIIVFDAIARNSLSGCRIFTALNGSDGIELAQTIDPDVILLDIIMPKMDGFEVCRRLKADTHLCDIPVIFLTALDTNRENRVKAMEVGAEAFLSKPPDELELIAQIKAMTKIKAANKLRRMEKEQLEELVAKRTHELELELAERNKAEEALRMSQELLCDISNNNGALIYAVDIDGRFLFLNNKLESLFGITHKALIGKPREEIMPPDVALRHRTNDLQVISERQSIVFEEENGEPDGKHTYLSAKFPLLDAQGEVYGVGGVSTDITARKQMERRQQLSTEILRIINEPYSLTDAISHIVTTIKLETEFDAVGIRLKSGDDYPFFTHNGFSDDFIAKENQLTILDEKGDICRDEDGNISLECTCGMIISGKTDPENPCFTPGGSCWTNNSLPTLDIPIEQDKRLHPRNCCVHEGYLSVAIIPIRINQEIVGLLQLNDRRKDRLTIDMVNFLEDICGRIGLALMQMQAESDLRDSEERQRTIIQTAMDGFWLTDMQGNLLKANETYCRMSGYSMEELLHMRISDLEVVETDDETVAHINRIMAQGEDRFESRHRRKDGTIFDVAVSAQYKPTNGEWIVSFLQDITERKRSEADLRESKENLRVILESTNDGILAIDKNNKIISANKRFAELWRIPKEIIDSADDDLLLGFVLNQLVNPTAFLDKVKILYNSTESDHDIIHFKDDRVYERFSNPLILNGSLNGRVWSFRDITESKRAEEALRESERSLSDAQHLAHIGNWRWIIATDTVIWSEELYDIMGYDLQLPPPSFAEMSSCYTTESWNRLGKVVDETLKSGASYELDLEIVRQDGVRRYTSTRGEADHDMDGNIVKLHGTVQDITDRKRVEEALRGSELRFKQVAFFAQEWIWEVDKDGLYTYVSDLSENLLGYKADEIVGKRYFYDFFTPEVKEGLKTAALDVFSRKESFWNFENPNIHKNGHEIILETSGSPILDTDGSLIGYRGADRDITERKQAESTLRMALKRLENVTGSVIDVIVSAVESRDPYTAGHQKRVSLLAQTIAIEMGLPMEQTEGIRLAGLVHDLGKISIPAEILSTPRKLSEIEFSLVKMHAQNGYDILKDVDFDWPVAQIVHQHHERLNGSGYPGKLKGDEIILEARILAVADVVEAMASHRPYRPSIGIEMALEEIASQKGILYDTVVVDTCLNLFRDNGYKLCDV